MNEVQIEGWLLKIDVEKTQAAFSNIDVETIAENFRAASRTMNQEVLGFCEILGIDPYKPSLLQAFPVDGNQVMYSGYYNLCGEIVEGELDEWDIVVDAHCFTLTEQNEGKPEWLTEPYFQIGFEVVLPDVSEKTVELIGK
ncbi:MAG: hypothetical protein RR595_06115 [Lysinibacillus sp.]